MVLSTSPSTWVFLVESKFWSKLWPALTRSRHSMQSSHDLHNPAKSYFPTLSLDWAVGEEVGVSDPEPLLADLGLDFWVCLFFPIVATHRTVEWKWHLCLARSQNSKEEDHALRCSEKASWFVYISMHGIAWPDATHHVTCTKLCNCIYASWRMSIYIFQPFVSTHPYIHFCMYLYMEPCPCLFVTVCSYVYPFTTPKMFPE